MSECPACPLQGDLAELRSRIDEFEVRWARHTGLFAQLLRDAERLTNVSVREISGRSRHVHIVRARFAVVWAARKGLGKSAPEIGRLLDDRDHTSIIHAERAARDRRERDPEFRDLTDKLVCLSDERKAL